MKARWQEAANSHTLGMAGQPAGNARKVASREQTVPSEVMVPLLQALITGALLLTLPLLVYVAFLLGGWKVAAWVGLVSVVIIAVWGVLLWVNRPMLWQIEEALQFDVNKDGRIGEVKTIIQGEIKEGRSVKRPEFPGDLIALRQFAGALIDKRATFSEREALRFGYKNFEDLRNLFFSNNWASWKDPNVHTLGIDMGLNGQGVLEILANSQDSE